MSKHGDIKIHVKKTQYKSSEENEYNISHE